MDGIVKYLKEVRDNVVSNHDDQVFSEGYNEAANLCVGLLSEKINGLLAKMPSGGLSTDEQKVFAELTKLKTETERRLYDFWSNQED